MSNETEGLFDMVVNASKEYRVYWISALDLDDVIIPNAGSTYKGTIRAWGCDDDDKPLPEQAKKFIDFAEDKGQVISLNKFIEEFNSYPNDERLSLTQDYIFITNKW